MPFVAENVCRYLSCTERTAQAKDFELILTVKMETRHPVEDTFGREFPAICNYCEVMTAWSHKTWKFCAQFLRFLEKRSFWNCRYCADRTQNLPGPVPHIWLTMFQISFKSVHFRRSHCRTREDRFCPVEYFQYRPFEPTATSSSSSSSSTTTTTIIIIIIIIIIITRFASQLQWKILARSARQR